MSVLSPGEEVPEEERLSAREQRSAEPCDNVPVIDNLPPAAGGDSEQGKYEEEVRNLYKQLDDKVRLTHTHTLLLLLKMKYTTSGLIHKRYLLQ